MLINAKFSGIVEKVVHNMLKEGIATTKAEAIRILAYEYDKNNPQKEDDFELQKQNPEEWMREFKEIRAECAKYTHKEVMDMIKKTEEKRKKEMLTDVY
ncbi:MAG: hypothetical protein ABIH83_01535 [Candidatus Micrarchaeota archaeon]